MDICLFMPVWILDLVDEVVGSGGGGGGGGETIPISLTLSILYFSFAPPHTSHILFQPYSPHILIIDPISLLASYCGILGLCSGMGERRLTPNMRPAGLAVSSHKMRARVSLLWSGWFHILCSNTLPVAAGL